MGQKETERLNQILLYAGLSRAMCSVAELGVADHIRTGEPQPVEHLAKATGTHTRSLYRTLRFLASYGLFQETKTGEFDHTPLSAVLRSDAEGPYRAAARVFHYFFPGWDGLDNAVKTGQPGFNKVFGKSVFEYVASQPNLGPILDAGMTSIHGYETAAMLSAYDFGGVRVVADIGGGNGSLISAVLQRYPNMKGILFDLGHVIGRSRENLKELGLADRCQVAEGSFFDTVPAGADTYMFRHVIHDWTDEQSVQILGHCRRVIPKDGKLLLIECVVPSGNGRSDSKDFDIAMMTFPGGIERTEPEFRALYEQAGFKLTRVVPTASMVSVVEGRPA